jgi:hypothetical protein
MKLRFASLLLLAMCVIAAVPSMASVIYSNGAINGQVQAYTINFGFSVSNSFTVSSPATMTGFDFGAWNFPGDQAVTVDWSIGTSFFGSDVASGTASLSNAFQFTNGLGFDIYNSTASGLSVALGTGTYYLTLANATTLQGNPMYWDQNSGPSLAMDSALGSVPSESFNIYGGGTSTPEPGTFLMLGSGVLGMAGLLRRKLNF